MSATATASHRPRQHVERDRDRTGAATGARAAVAFYTLACVIAWGWSFALLAAGQTVRRGHIWPTHFIALFAPAIAALAVTGSLSGRRGIGELARRITRWRIGVRWWAVALSPIAFLAVGVAVASATGHTPRAHQFALYAGWPAIGIAGAALAALLNGFGEETGWRGFLLPALVPRYGARRASLIIAGFWALWHLPFFFLLASYSGMAPFAFVGFAIGIASGSLVLTWLYYQSGQSIIAVAVWHASYNMAAATAASSGTVAAIASVLVIVQAIVLLRHDARALMQSGQPVIGPLPAASDE